MGFQVFGGYRKAEDGARLMVAGISPVRLDVTDAESVSAAAEEIESFLNGDRFAGLVNNSGVPGAGPIAVTPVAIFRNVMEVNYFGALRVTQAFLPLIKRSRGRVIMMSSISGLISMPYLSPYAASKFALEALSDSLRRECVSDGVDVIVIEPGPIRTAIWDRVEDLDLPQPSDALEQRRLERFREQALASGRSGLPPEAVAKAVAHALTTRRPPIRMLIGSPSARLQTRFVRWLPDRIADRLIFRRLT